MPETTTLQTETTTQPNSSLDDSGKQCRRYGGARGAVPPNGCMCPPIKGLLKILFVEHHSMLRQLTMIE